MIQIEANLKHNPLHSVVFMGTPELAVDYLKVLVSCSEYIKGVVTQPDRPVGRGYRLLPTPVKKYALDHSLPVYQPDRKDDLVKVIDTLSPDIIFVIAYGMILPPAIVNNYLCINIHASLLPKYRGPSPIQSAIVNGEEETGVSVMIMDEGMDTGPVILEHKVQLSPDENSDMLASCLGRAAVTVVPDTLKILREERENINIKYQDASEATYTKKITKADGLLDLSVSPEIIVRKVKGLNPWPGTYVNVDSIMVKILDATLTHEGNLKILKVQPAGKRPMTYEDYLRGHKPLK